VNARWWIFISAAVLLAGCGEYVPPHVMNSPPAKRPIPDRQRDSDRFITVAKPVQPAAESHKPQLQPPEAALVERPYTEWTVSETAAEALARTGTAALPELAQRLQSSSAAARLSAAQMIARIGPDAARSIDLLEALVDRLENPQEQPNVRRACARAIGQIGPALTPAPPQPPSPRPVVPPLPTLTPEQMLDPQTALWHEREETRRQEEEARWTLRHAKYEAALADYQRRMQLAERAAQALLALTDPQEVAIAPATP
jgi:hypothetical protein